MQNDLVILAFATPVEPNLEVIYSQFFKNTFHSETHDTGKQLLEHISLLMLVPELLPHSSAFRSAKREV